MEAKGCGSAGCCRGKRDAGEPVVCLEGKACLPEGAGHHRVRHLGRRAGCHRHIGHIGVQTPASGALGCHSHRYQQLVRDDSGQSTVEYAVLLFGVLSVVLALATFSNLATSGLVVEHALSAASHHLGSSVSGLVDAFMF